MRTLALAALTITFGATILSAHAHAQSASPAASATAAASPSAPPAQVQVQTQSQDPPAPLAQPVPPPAPPPGAYPAQPMPYYGQPYYGPQGYPVQPYYVPTAASRRPRIVGYRNEERSVKAMWLPGMVAFLAGWVLDFGVATPLANAISNDRDSAVEQDAWAWSLVPLAGPLVQLGIGAPHPAIPLVMLTLQGVGLGLFIAGMVMQEQVRVAIYEGDPDDPTATRATLSATPVEGGAQLAVTLTHL